MPANAAASRARSNYRRLHTEILVDFLVHRAPARAGDLLPRLLAERLRAAVAKCGARRQIRRLRVDRLRETIGGRRRRDLQSTPRVLRSQIGARSVCKPPRAPMAFAALWKIYF